MHLIVPISSSANTDSSSPTFSTFPVVAPGLKMLFPDHRATSTGWPSNIATPTSWVALVGSPMSGSWEPGGVKRTRRDQDDMVRASGRESIQRRGKKRVELPLERAWVKRGLQRLRGEEREAKGFAAASSGRSPTSADLLSADNADRVRVAFLPKPC